MNTPSGPKTSKPRAAALKTDALTTHTKQSIPRILLIDVDGRVDSALTEIGFSTTSGSFGTAHAVKRSGRFLPVESNGHLDRYTEQDIVVVDLGNRQHNTEPYNPEEVDGVSRFWMSCAHGEVDPRPLEMLTARENLDRILDNGGIFVIFAHPRREIEYVSGALRGFSLDPDQTYQVNDWGFLSALEPIQTVRDRGNDIRAERTRAEAVSQVRQHLQSGEFFCTLSRGRANTARYYIEDAEWLTLATNRYGSPVAAAITPSKAGRRKGWIFIFHRVDNQAQLLQSLLSGLFPTITPELFPDLKQSRWLHRPEYEIPSVLDLQSRIEQVRTSANNQITELTHQLEKQRKQHADWYTLMSGTGDELVQAVIRTLQRVGFKQVVDVDAEARSSAADGSQLREDIRIHDSSPILVVDVKGITGHPEDAEAQQAEKHTLMRSRDLKRTDLQALSIINAQRHIPPLDRDLNAYRKPLIQNALQVGSGLMTTWDLCLILRGIEEHGWSPENVKPIFYQTGRVQVLPAHYRLLGEVVKVWKQSIGFIPRHAVSVGDTIAITPGDGTFREVLVGSIMVDGTGQQCAVSGSNCGVSLDKSSGIKEGHIVYFVDRQVGPDKDANHDSPVPT